MYLKSGSAELAKTKIEYGQKKNNKLWGAWGMVLCTLDSGVQNMCMRTDFQSLVPRIPNALRTAKSFLQAMVLRCLGDILDIFE